MKRTLVLIMVASLLLITTPVYAYTPPEQGSANATDIILWHGDNLTISTANVTITSLEDAMVAAAEAQAAAINDNNSDIAAGYLLLLIMAMLIALVFWQKSILLYSVGGPVAIVYGLSLATADAELSLWLAGVVIAIIGTSFVYQVIKIAFDWVRNK